MSSRFWDKNPAQRSLFGTASRTEPDMRQELINFLDGKWPEIAKGQTAVLRKMRREDGQLIECACVDDVTHEPDRDSFCPFCHGEGFFWDEVFVSVYRVILGSEVGQAVREQVIAPGLMNVPLVVFYLRSSVLITPEDKIVELVRDEEGQPVRPYKRSALYRISSLVDLRSDNGRLEYWKAGCYKEERKFLNGHINGG